MHVTVKLHATLRKYLPTASTDNSVAMELPEGTTVADLITRLAIPADHAQMIVAGDQHLELSSPVRDGQEINVFPPLAGGR